MSYSFNPYPVVGAVRAAVIAALFSIFLLFVTFFLGPWTFIIIILVWALTLLRIVSVFLMAKYQVLTLEKNSITYRVGVFSHSSVVLPYQKITEASYSQGFIQRIFGVGTLRLDSAGGSQVAIYVQDVRHVDVQKTLREIDEKGGKVDTK
ncbi:PH domain-containing protein [Candidatus Micrarchaeota archaeon]|nr:PH domain-containing protein [Candidatus Micrarchaeota archaeon]